MPHYATREGDAPRRARILLTVGSTTCVCTYIYTPRISDIILSSDDDDDYSDYCPQSSSGLPPSLGTVRWRFFLSYGCGRTWL